MTKLRALIRAVIEFEADGAEIPADIRVLDWKGGRCWYTIEKVEEVIDCADEMAEQPVDVVFLEGG